MSKWVLVAVISAAVLGLAAYSALHRTSLAFTLGVPPAFPAVSLHRGQTACQAQIDVPANAAFDQVAVPVGTYFRRGSPLLATIRDAGGRRIAIGRLGGGYPDIGQRSLERIHLNRSVSASRIAACITNRGPRRVALFGNGGQATRRSVALKNGRPLPFDITFSFERRPRSLAAMARSIAARASLWRFPGMPAWSYAALAVLLVLAGPLLLARALSAATLNSSED
jgi:hypothetical protein